MNGLINWKQINDYMQQGYSYVMKHDSVSACNEWKKVWNTIISTMASGKYNFISDLDNDFDGDECILNWISDYEMELGNASIKDASFCKTRIDFCMEYLHYTSDKNEHNSLNMRRAIAESYFQLGEIEAGEKEFRNLTNEHPTWGWGWIGWSDEYDFYSKSENHSKAIEILTQALKIDGIDEKNEIKSRLKDLYISCEMVEEANSIVIEERNFGVSLAEINNISKDAHLIVNKALKLPEHNIKIGRNEPCPCGSGKKYKHCCLV